MIRKRTPDHRQCEFLATALIAGAAVLWPMVGAQAELKLMSLSAGSAPTELALAEPELPDDVLEQQRGGFLVGNLEISIGLEQVVAVNGETVAVSRLHIPNLNQHSGIPEIDQQLETALTLATPDLPPGTVVDTSLINNSGILTRIQNSLNDTVIQNMRHLNIELNNFDPNQRLPGDLDTTYLQTLINNR